MTQEQIIEVDDALQRGETPDEVAAKLGLSRTSLNYRLLRAGKKITVFRRLATTSVDDGRREQNFAGGVAR